MAVVASGPETGRPASRTAGALLDHARNPYVVPLTLGVVDDTSTEVRSEDLGAGQEVITGGLAAAICSISPPPGFSAPRF
jgi:hypothetical protein